MTRKDQHPDRLFDYLNGTLDQQTERTIESHLSVCPECTTVARFVRLLKEKLPLNQQSDEASRLVARSEHPDVSELATFFYSKSRTARSRKTAAHVSICRRCADDLAEYAQAARAAAEYDEGGVRQGEVSSEAWELIREWEESSLAQPKSVAYTDIDQARLSMLTRLLSEHREKLQSMAQESLIHSAGAQPRADLVPVIIVDQAGTLRRVEIFERTKGADGNEILRHPEKSEHFHQKPFHAILDFGEEKQVVVSEYVRRHRVLLHQHGRSSADLRRVDYFIIED